MVNSADMPLGDWNLHKSFDCMRYADGTPIQRRDVVYIPGEPNGGGMSGLWKVIGFDLGSEVLMLEAPNGAVRRVDPNRVSRW